MVKKNPEKVILLNKIDTGSYANEGKNILHEVINQFVSDDGTRFLYVTPNGSIDFTKHNVNDILFVRGCGMSNTVEVVALAREITEIKNLDLSKQRYGGVSLESIFEENIHKGKQNKLGQINCMARHMFVPAISHMFISLKKRNSHSYPECKWISLNSTKSAVVPRMRGYYSAVDSSRLGPESDNAYSQLRKLINDEKLWNEPPSHQIDSTANLKEVPKPTFLEITGKQYDELAFSNLLAYYFNNRPEVFVAFAREFLKIDFSSNLSIVRESMDNIDIWVEDEHHIVAIENKI